MRKLLILALLALPLSVVAQELPLGSAMPTVDQAFPALAGGTGTLGALAGQRGTAVVFWSMQCPWVDRYEARVQALASQFAGQGVSVVLIGRAGDEARARERGITLPYLTDDGSIQRAFRAARAPQVFVFDAGRTLTYVGTVDDNPTNAQAAQRRYLHDALEATLGGRAPALTRTEALGCLLRTN